jgi:hypothetical protein
MEVKILPVIFKLSIFSEKIVKIKSGKFVGSASFHEGYPLKGVFMSDCYEDLKTIRLHQIAPEYLENVFLIIVSKNSKFPRLFYYFFLGFFLELSQKIMYVQI